MAFNRERFKRTEMMLGSKAMDHLETAVVTVIGLGAVGSHAVEALARSGIGTLRIVDFDVITLSNFNRQLLATEDTLGQKKTDAARHRLRQINPDIQVTIFDTFCHTDTMDALFPELIPSPSSSKTAEICDSNDDDFHNTSSNNHVVIDAIDCLNPKVNILVDLVTLGMKVVSCMGAARRTDPGAIRSGDISETLACPLAKSVRKRLRRRGIESGIHCVYSTEIAKKESVSKHVEENYKNEGRPRNPMGSLSMISGIFGYIAALEAIKMLLEDKVRW